MAIVNQGFEGKRGQRKRLPPGQSEVIRWPVLTYGPTPHITTQQWRLTIDGEVRKPLTLDWQAFTALPTTTLTTDIHCVTRWSRLGMEWRGVSLDELIMAAHGLTDEARFVIATSYGDYTTNLPVEDVLDEQALIATHAHDEPLSDEHGGPARLFVPHLYFWKSAKWITRLQFVSQDQPGFWEVNGYHNYGDPWREQRYDSDR